MKMAVISYVLAVGELSDYAAKFRLIAAHYAKRKKHL